MKDFIVRLDEIDDLFSRLYEFCEDHHYFTVRQDSVEVYEKIDAHSSKLVATIQIVAIDEPYDVIDELRK